MGHHRTVAVSLALCCVVATPVAAVAAPSSCVPVVSDARDDEAAGLYPGESYRQDLDLLAVDLSSTTSRLVVTVQMAGYDSAPVPARLVDVLFDVGPTTYNAYKYLGPEGTIYGFNNSKGGHAVTGTTDPRTGTVRIQIPRSLLAAATGAVVHDVTANTDELVGNNANAYGFSRDAAGSRRTYRLGTHGCL